MVWSGKICNAKVKEVSKVRFSASFLNTSQVETNECVLAGRRGEEEKTRTKSRQRREDCAVLIDRGKRVGKGLRTRPRLTRSEPTP